MSSVPLLRRTAVLSSDALALAPVRRGAAAPHWVGLSLLLLGLWAGAAAAQTDVPDNGSLLAATSEAPGRVGRVGEMQGRVWWYDPEAREWTAAERNRPLVRGDRLSTDAGARAELTVGSTLLRLDGDTELTFEALDDRRVVVELLHGSAQLRVRNAEAADEWTVRTADGEVQFARTGSYRVDQREGSSHVTVSSGEARFVAAGLTQTVLAGQRGEFWRQANGRGDYSLTDPPSDAFSAWVQTRERLIASSASAARVSAEMTGVDDLDRYGDWRHGGEQGELWFPREVASGWAPYSQGQWRWVAPWGWTWVDAAPWGFAPFHYGAWVQWQGRWGWSPGARGTARAVFSPGLVVWGNRGGVSFSIDIFGRRQVPTPGWRPMHPHEARVRPAPRPVVVVSPPPPTRHGDDRRSERWPERRDNERRDNERRDDERRRNNGWPHDNGRSNSADRVPDRVGEPRFGLPHTEPARRGDGTGDGAREPQRQDPRSAPGPLLGRGFPPDARVSPQPPASRPVSTPAAPVIVAQPAPTPVVRGGSPSVDPQPRGESPIGRGRSPAAGSTHPDAGARVPHGAGRTDDEWVKRRRGAEDGHSR